MYKIQEYIHDHLAVVILFRNYTAVIRWWSYGSGFCPQLGSPVNNNVSPQFYSIKLLIKNKLIRHWTLEHTSVHRNHPKLFEVYLDILVLAYIHWCCNSRKHVHRQKNTPSPSNWYQHPQHNQTEQQGVSGTYCMISMFLVIHRRAEWYAASRGGQRVQHHPSPWPLRSLCDLS